MKRSLSLGRPTPWQLTLYVLAGLATVGFWFWANMLYNRFTIGPGYWEYVYAGNWIFQLLFAVTVYGTVVGLSLTAQAWRRERDRDRSTRSTRCWRSSTRIRRWRARWSSDSRTS